MIFEISNSKSANTVYKYTQFLMKISENGQTRVRKTPLKLKDMLYKKNIFIIKI